MNAVKKAWSGLWRRHPDKPITIEEYNNICTRAEFRNMFESLKQTKNDLENSLKAVNHQIERFKNRV